MARRSTPERSRARVQSDSSQSCGCRGRRCKDRTKWRRRNIEKRDMASDDMTFLDTEKRQALQSYVYEGESLDTFSDGMKISVLASHTPESI